MRVSVPLVFLLLLFTSCSREKTIRPQYKNIVETVYASGNILPQDEYKVFALSNGTIVEKKVKDGDEVKKGEILYVVSNSAQKAMLDAAQAAHQNAIRDVSENSPVLNDLELAMRSAEVKFQNDSLNFVRYSNLWKEQATNKAAYDNAKMSFDVSLNQKKSSEEKYHSTKNQLQITLGNAKSQLASAEETLGNFIIRSDSDGTVFQTFKEKGEAVHSGELVALMGKKNSRIIRLSIDQQDIDKIKTGQQVLLKTDVTGKTIYQATVSQIYPVMNEADQTFRVDAFFSDSVTMPYVHSSVEANILIQKKDHALILPRNLLISDDSVMVKAGGKNKTVAVKTGIMTLDDAEIISGVDENSDVVIPVSK